LASEIYLKLFYTSIFFLLRHCFKVVLGYDECNTHPWFIHESVAILRKMLFMEPYIIGIKWYLVYRICFICLMLSLLAYILNKMEYYSRPLHKMWRIRFICMVLKYSTCTIYKWYWTLLKYTLCSAWIVATCKEAKQCCYL
jgi:hypothetical protein